MIVYVAVVKGVYRHDVLGVFSMAVKAICVAEKFVADPVLNKRGVPELRYHDVEILRVDLDEPATAEQDEPYLTVTWDSELQRTSVRGGR